MSDAKVFYDFEFTFTSGVKEYAQAEDGRDTIELTSDPIRLVIQHEDAVETIEVSRSALACQRIAKRTIQPDDSPDAVIERQLAEADAQS